MNPTVILFACANCDTQLTVPVSLGGMSDFCPLCQHKITSPTLEEYIDILTQKEAAKPLVSETPAPSVPNTASEEPEINPAEPPIPPEPSHATKESEDRLTDLDDEALTKSLQDVFKDHPPRPSKTPLETRAESSPEWSTSDLVDVFKHQPRPSEKKTSEPATPESPVTLRSTKNALSASNELLIPLVEDTIASESSQLGGPEIPSESAKEEPFQASDPVSPELKTTVPEPAAPTQPAVPDPKDIKPANLEALPQAPVVDPAPKSEPAEALSLEAVSPPIATVSIPSNQALIDGASVHVDFSPPKSSPMTPPKAPLNERELLSELTVPEFQQAVEKTIILPSTEESRPKKEVLDQSPTEFESKPLTSPNWEEPKSVGKETLPFLAGSKPKTKVVNSEKSSTETVIKVTKKLNILPEGEQSISELLNLTPLEKKRSTPVSAEPRPKASISEPLEGSQTDAAAAAIAPQVIDKSAGRQWIEVPAISTTSRRSKRFKRNLSIGVTCFLLIDLALLWLFQEPIKEKWNLNARPSTQERATAQDSQRTNVSPPAAVAAVPLSLNSPLLLDVSRSGNSSPSITSDIPKAIPIPADSVMSFALEPTIEPTKLVSLSSTPETQLPLIPVNAPVNATPETLSNASEPDFNSAPSETSEASPKVIREGETPESLPAFQVLESFLNADSWKARIPFIWKPEVHGKNIEAYEKTSESQKIEFTHIKLYSQNPSNESVPAHCIFSIQEANSSRKIIVIVLFDSKSKAYKVDSQAFIEFRDDLLTAFCKNPGAPPQTFRVSVRRGHVVGEDSKIHASRVPFSITFPGSAERHTVFSARGSEISRELVDSLGWEFEKTYMIQLKWHTTGDTPWIELEKIQSNSWHRSEP